MIYFGVFMGLRMWKRGKSNDYTLFDKAIGEQFNMGGVDMWVYSYTGPAGNNGSTDSTLPDYSKNAGGVTSIGDLVLGETTQRNYSLDAITVPCVYQVVDATPDLKISGLIYNPMKMAITVHYNTMIQRIGRKLMPGDVLELPNLRDTDVLGKDTGINRFYVVVDAFRSADGYSATWQNHIFKVRVDPLTDSPEYGNLTGGNDYTGTDPNNPDTSGSGSSGNENSNYDREMDIMNKIVSQGDEEAQYIHWTNEHIYDDYENKDYLIDDILSGYEYPEVPFDKMFFIKKSYPVLHYLDGSEWKIEETTNGETFPTEPYDGMFFFKKDTIESSWILYQYSSEHKKFLQCDLPFSNDSTGLPEGSDFYYSCVSDTLYQFKKGVWNEITTDPSQRTFTTKDMTGVKNNPANYREMIPPARGTVGEGNIFPEYPKDKEFFYRTDYTPVTLWQFNSSMNVWSQFKYGGRRPWTGANLEQTDFINSPDRVSIHDVLKPNTQYRKK